MTLTPINFSELSNTESFRSSAFTLPDMLYELSDECLLKENSARKVLVTHGYVLDGVEPKSVSSGLLEDPLAPIAKLVVRETISDKTKARIHFNSC